VDAATRPSSARVAVVGAGIAGLTAARQLRAAGVEVAVFDKGRGPGGRVSSRRREPFVFDHGAQYFTARDPAFRAEVEDWCAAGVVARWDGRIVSLEAGRVGPAPRESERFVGVPRMSALARHLAAGLEVRCGVRATGLDREAAGWRLRTEAGAGSDRWDALVLTAPPPQSAALLAGHSPLAARLEEVAMQPCWAGMLAFDGVHPAAFDGAFCRDAALDWIARDSSKPGRGGGEAWVLHATPAWSAAHLDAAPAEVLGELGAALERVTALVAPPVLHRDAHRWSLARPADEGGCGPLTDLGARLVFAGDAVMGGRVEGAYLAGREAARALLGVL
jgi:renalase